MVWRIWKVEKKMKKYNGMEWVKWGNQTKGKSISALIVITNSLAIIRVILANHLWLMT